MILFIQFGGNKEFIVIRTSFGNFMAAISLCDGCRCNGEMLFLFNNSVKIIFLRN